MTYPIKSFILLAAVASPTALHAQITHQITDAQTTEYYRWWNGSGGSADYAHTFWAAGFQHGPTGSAYGQGFLPLGNGRDDSGFTSSVVGGGNTFTQRADGTANIAGVISLGSTPSLQFSFNIDAIPDSRTGLSVHRDLNYDLRTPSPTGNDLIGPAAYTDDSRSGGIIDPTAFDLYTYDAWTNSSGDIDTSIYSYLTDTSMYRTAFESWASDFLTNPSYNALKTELPKLSGVGAASGIDVYLVPSASAYQKGYTNQFGDGGTGFHLEEGYSGWGFYVVDDSNYTGTDFAGANAPHTTGRFDFQFNTVPEPSSSLLVTLSALSVITRRKRSQG